VRVDRFEVKGNTLLPAAQIDAALAPYTGERTMADIQQAAAAVQALYAQAGYGAVVAFVPEQSPGAGSVVIEVREGRIGQINVKGNQHFSTAGVRAALPDLQPGETPRVRRIDAQIQMANENPSRRIEVLLQPGAQAGDVDANLTVAEQSLQRWSVRADNTGDAHTGHFRIAAGWQHADITGHDDVLSTEIETAPEDPSSVVIVSGAYRLPFYARGVALDAYLAYSDIDGGTTSTAAGGLTFSGKGDVAGLRLTQYLPRLGESDQRASVGLENRDYRNSCRIGAFGEGACGPAGASVTVQPLSLGYSLQQGGGAPFGLNANLVHNLMLGGDHGRSTDFEAVRPGGEPHYTLLRLNGFGAVALPADLLLQARLAAQFTGDGLVPGEQFGLGGALSVRGYEERELAGDSGAALSVELVSPELARRAAGDLLSVHLLGFGDVGWIRNELDTPCLGSSVECALGSLGVGGRLAAGGFQARLDVARAFKTGSTTQRGDWRLHAAASYAF
jgi:hemolysin activation/secretion protein